MIRMVRSGRGHEACPDKMMQGRPATPYSASFGVRVELRDFDSNQRVRTTQFDSDPKASPLANQSKC